ncbi:MAG: PAS domain S-box protein, partial [Myxococcota bacterium]
MTESEERSVAEVAALFPSEVMEALPDFVFTLTREGFIAGFNSVAAGELGWDVSTHKGRHFSELLAPEEKAAAMDRFARRIGGASSKPLELKVRTSRGDYAPFEFTVKPIVKNGAVIGVVGVGRDLRLRKAYEDALEKNEARYRTFTDLAGDAIFSLDPAGCIVIWNRAAREIFGYRAGEVLGKPASFLFPADATVKGREWSGIFDEGRHGTAEGNFEVTARRMDGSTFPAMLSVTTWRASAGVFIACLVRDLSQKKRTEKALAESEIRYQSLVENAPLGIFAADAGGRLTFANNAMLDMLGSPRFDASRHFNLLTNVRYPGAEASGLFRRCLETGEKQVAELPHRSLWGREIIARLHVVPVRDSNGDPAGFHGVVEDVTQQRASEDALRSAGLMFRSLVEQALTGIFISQAGKFVYVNPKICEMLGYSSDELKAMDSTFDVIAPEDHGMVMDAIARRVSGESRHISYIKRIVRRDGQRLVVELHGDIIDYESGPATIGVVLDITGRMEAEKTLRESEERYRALSESSPDYIFIVKPDGMLEYVNTSAAAALGLKPSDMIGRRMQEFFPPETANRQQNGIESVFRAGVPFLSETCMKVRGRDLWLNNILVPLIDENGKPRAVLGVSRNVTERREAENRLRDKTAELEAIYLALPDLVFRLGKDGTILDCKTDNEGRLALPREQFLGRKISEVLPQEVASAHTAAAEKVLRTGEVATFEYSLPHLDTRMRFEARLVRIFSDQLIAFIRDITETKRTEEALRGAEQLFRTLVEQVMTGIYITQEGRYVYVNPGLCQILGYSSEEFLAFESTFDVVHPDDVNIALTELQRRISGEVGKISYSLRAIKKDGTLATLEVYGDVIEYQGRPAVIGVVLDISDRVRTEEALLDQERYRALFERSLDCVYLHDLEGRFLDANDAMLETVGYGLGELAGTEFTALMDDEQKELAHETFAEISRTGSQKSPIIYRLCTRDG